MALAAQRIERLLDHRQLTDLMEHVEAGCVSIYMPVHRGGPEVIREDPIRLKNQLQQATGQLIQTGWRSCDARDHLAELNSLLEDSEFWRHNDQGLAMFISSLRKGVFRTPMPVETRVVVSSRFYLKPLLPLLEMQKTFYILALSQEQVRLLEVTSFGVRPLELPKSTPTCIEDLTKFEEVQKVMEFHSSSAPQPPGSRRPAVFYGTVSGSDEGVDKKDVLWYCQAVHVGVEKALAQAIGQLPPPWPKTPGGGVPPLVLASVDPLLSIYREVNTYAGLSDRQINGSAQRLSDKQLRQKGLDLLRDVLEEPVSRDAWRYQQAAAAGQGSAKLAEVLPAAHDSRVETIFVNRDAHIPGRYDPVSQKIEQHETALAGDQDLLDLAAVRTYLAAGRVHVVPPQRMPNGSPVAAIFRFPLQR
jgi:hypothetical protein